MATDREDGGDWHERMDTEFEAAEGRDAKRAVLDRYMGANMADEAIGRLTGDHDGDVVERRETASASDRRSG